MGGLGLLLVAGSAVAADPGAVPPPEACARCHPDEGLSGHDGRELRGCAACHEAQAGTRPIVPSAPNGGAPHLVLSPADDATCLACHDAPPGRYAHPEVEASRCSTCHDPHDDSDQKARLYGMTDEATCGRCHELESHRRTHTILKRGSCVTCHVLHDSEQRDLLAGEDVNAPCAECHDTLAHDHDVPHNPALEGDCAACHDAHGSDFPGNLVLSPSQVCFQCHKERPAQLERHSAYTLGRCAGCHEPHGSDHSGLVRQEPMSGTCFRCHTDDVTGRAFVHAPVAAGHCEMCHEPHTSSFPRGMRTPVNFTCGMCHIEEARPDLLWPHQAVKADGCVVCHDAHGSNYELGLRRPVMELCTSCHPGYEDGQHAERTVRGTGHPMGPGVDDPLVEGRELTCVSCHNPHGSNNPAMFYRGFQRMAMCVECHRKTLAKGTRPGASRYEMESEEARQRDLERRRTKDSGGGADRPAEPTER